MTDILIVISYVSQDFVVLHMPSDFRLYHGHFECYITRLWVLFKYNGAYWYFCFKLGNPSISFQTTSSNTFSVGWDFYLSLVFKIFVMLFECLACVALRGQTETRVVVYLLVQFLKSLVCWFRPDPHMHSLGVRWVHKLIYGVAFMSSFLSSISQYFLVPWGSPFWSCGQKPPTFMIVLVPGPSSKRTERENK